MTDTPTTRDETPPKRSWRRFTLRALFLGVLAAGIFFGWVAYRARFLQQQYAWLKEFQSRHRNALTLKPISNEWFWRPLIGDAAVTVRRAVLNGYSYEQQTHTLTDEVLEQVKGWTEVEQLLLAGPAITDETIRFVRRLPKLTLLGLEDTGITDAGTAHLVHLHVLKELAIVTHRDRAPVAAGAITEACLKNLVAEKDLDVLGLGVRITDEGLGQIVANCPNLIHLELNDTRITRRGLANLRSLTKLARLRVADNHSIDDAAVLELAGLPTLTWLWLERTSVSPPGVAALQTQLPGAWIRVEESQIAHDYRSR